MAGLLVKELKLRAAIERCLILMPALLTIQWQDELLRFFNGRSSSSCHGRSGTGERKTAVAVSGRDGVRRLRAAGDRVTLQSETGR